MTTEIIKGINMFIVLHNRRDKAFPETDKAGRGRENEIKILKSYQYYWEGPGNAISLFLIKAVRN